MERGPERIHECGRIIARLDQEVGIKLQDTDGLAGLIQGAGEAAHGLGFVSLNIDFKEDALGLPRLVGQQAVQAAHGKGVRAQLDI